MEAVVHTIIQVLVEVEEQEIHLPLVLHKEILEEIKDLMVQVQLVVEELEELEELVLDQLEDQEEQEFQTQ